MKKNIFIILLLFAFFTTFAQRDTAAKTPPFEILSKGTTAVQLFLGSQGIGLDYRALVAPKFGVRVGFSAIPRLGLVANSGRYSNDISGHILNAHSLVDYSPFSKGAMKFFKFVIGFAYISGKGTYVRTPYDGAFKFGDISLTSEEVGRVVATTEYKGFAPYAGIGAFDFLKSKKWGVNMDFGTYFLPRPNTSIDGSGMLIGMNSQNDQLQENLKGYRWLPVIQFNLIYKL